MVASAAAEPKVVVTSKPIHSLVAGVMMGVGAPRLLVEGNASPHTYALKPSDAKALNGADVVFRVSEALEPFTGKVFRSLPRSVRSVSLAEAPGLELLERREGGPFETHAHGNGRRGHRHAHGSGKEGRETTDPHVWLDPRNAARMIEHAANVLAEVAPRDAERIRANAAAMAERLGALDRELEAALKPLAGRPFVVFHDSLQYLEARYGLTAVGSITVSPDQQPSARRLTDLRRKIVGLDAVCVLAEPQFPGKLVDSLTEGTRARRAVVDPEGGLIEAGPELYAQLMRGTAAALFRCLARN
jgi:zinc transport system substrate-binding protein